MLKLAYDKKSLSATPFKHFTGITLIELITSVSIASILTTIAVPNLNQFLVKLRVNNEISMLHRSLLIARNYAINTDNNVIMCPLGDDGNCSTHWQSDISVFIDINNNKRFDKSENETIVSTKEAIKSGDKLIYGKGRSKVIYQPTGHLSGLTNGTFRYCPQEFPLAMARGIVVARSGRFYSTTDINNDSIDETRNKKKLTCD